MNWWCILRTAPSRTLNLAASLAEDGFAVWTPVETVTKRIPRANVRRQVRLPILAGFVFADVAHLGELLGLAHMPVKPRRGAGCAKPAHAGFSVMRWNDKIPTIADADLSSLRRLEAKRTPLKKAKALRHGTKVKAMEGSGSFTGMVGVVIRSKCDRTFVSFGGLFGRTELPTSLLSDDQVDT